MVQDDLTQRGYLQFPRNASGTKMMKIPLGEADIYGMQHNSQKTDVQSFHVALPHCIWGYSESNFHFKLHYVRDV